MNDLLIKKLDTFTTYQVDIKSTNIINKNEIHNLNIDEFLEISNILDSSHFNYGIDKDLNFIALSNMQ